MPHSITLKQDDEYGACSLLCCCGCCLAHTQYADNDSHELLRHLQGTPTVGAHTATVTTWMAEPVNSTELARSNATVQRATNVGIAIGMVNGLWTCHWRYLSKCCTTLLAGCAAEVGSLVGT